MAYLRRAPGRSVQSIPSSFSQAASVRKLLGGPFDPSVNPFLLVGLHLRPSPQLRGNATRMHGAWGRNARWSSLNPIAESCRPRATDKMRKLY